MQALRRVKRECRKRRQQPRDESFIHVFSSKWFSGRHTARALIRQFCPCDAEAGPLYYGAAEDIIAAQETRYSTARSIHCMAVAAAVRNSQSSTAFRQSRRRRRRRHANRSRRFGSAAQSAARRHRCARATPGLWRSCETAPLVARLWKSSRSRVGQARPLWPHRRPDAGARLQRIDVPIFNRCRPRADQSRPRVALQTIRKGTSPGGTHAVRRARARGSHTQRGSMA
jgi:hypothetical protein